MDRINDVINSNSDVKYLYTTNYILSLIPTVIIDKPALENVNLSTILNMGTKFLLTFLKKLYLNYWSGL